VFRWTHIGRGAFYNNIFQSLCPQHHSHKQAAIHHPAYLSCLAGLTLRLFLLAEELSLSGLLTVPVFLELGVVTFSDNLLLSL
jgi:hypothetical protein